ncbi:hypothetical protein B0J12DRAFT_568688, partial [Macrophomina phaseolina]
GRVITGTQDYLERCLDVLFLQHADDSAGLRGLKKIPALQNSGVVTIAYAGYHYHALHSSGTTISYVMEPRSCGVLGHGEAEDGHAEAESHLRGLQGIMDGRQLVQNGCTTGRKVWFNKANGDWMRFLSLGVMNPAEAQVRIPYVDHRPGPHRFGRG